MLSKLTPEQKNEFGKVISCLGQSLDISETQYNALVQSYEAVGEFLQNDEELSKYGPLVTPQGSLRLGTIIQPVNPDDDMDVDLVFRLSEKNPEWTQKTIKDMVGARLNSSERYKPMMDKKEGRRCWTLLYRQDSANLKERYHMDILPAVATKDYEEQMRRVFSESFSVDKLSKVAIRITDKDREGYSTQTNVNDWLKSNPDGYAIWFANRCKKKVSSRQLLTEDIVPLKKYNPEKTPLQRIVQILKRHRDLMFPNDDNKPISIIITTLSAQAYNGESDILEGLSNVVMNMHKFITKDENGKDKVANPLNPVENFADKWIETPDKRDKFYSWLFQVRKDIASILGSSGAMIWDSVGKSFGKNISEAANKLYTQNASSFYKSGVARIGVSGILGSVGQNLNASNTFHGKEE